MIILAYKCKLLTKNWLRVFMQIEPSSSSQERHFYTEGLYSSVS